MEEHAESQTSNDDLCPKGECGDVFQATTTEVELHGKDGKDQGITSQKTEQRDALATYHEDLMDGTPVNLPEEHAQLIDLMCRMRQDVDGLRSTLQGCVDDHSITTDDVTRLKNEEPNCEVCSVIKDRINSIHDKFHHLCNTWHSVVQEMRQELKKMSIAVLKQKGEFLEIKEALDSVEASLARSR